ncbi:HNH endonuclease [Roseibium sp.]|uniref:HNH endonuclease n=1 Tax=Roseibium sp. TaxID=1936156 RepID=UPI003518B855
MTLEAAQAFILQNVIEPGLAHHALENKTKKSLKNASTWIKHMPSVGDLNHYLSSAVRSANKQNYNALKEHNLLTFEDIRPEFEIVFRDEINQYFDPNQIKVGETTNSYFVNILGRSYNLQSSGILPVKFGNAVAYTVIKCTLEGGEYDNEWLEEDITLKYYLKKNRGEYSITHSYNAAIIENPEVPIHAFIRATKKESFQYAGILYYRRLHREGEAKWFEFTRFAAIIENQPPLLEIQTDLQNQVEKSRSDDAKKRKERLQRAPRKPTKRLATVEVFERNPDVIAEALEQANGVCGACGRKGPFKRRRDGSLFLEVHHIKPLSDGGDDALDNVIALCPNCHRNEHFGSPVLMPTS